MNIPTCEKPTDPKAIYIRSLYKTFFWGPFEDEQAAIDAIRTLDKIDPMWDYDPFCIIYGSDPLPKDFVCGFLDIEKAMKNRIYAARSQKSLSPYVLPSSKR